VLYSIARQSVGPAVAQYAWHSASVKYLVLRESPCKAMLAETVQFMLATQTANNTSIQTGLIPALININQLIPNRRFGDDG